jgi:hypothetical protein
MLQSKSGQQLESSRQGRIQADGATRFFRPGLGRICDRSDSESLELALKGFGTLLFMMLMHGVVWLAVLLILLWLLLMQVTAKTNEKSSTGSTRCRIRMLSGR